MDQVATTTATGVAAADLPAEMASRDWRISFLSIAPANLRRTASAARGATFFITPTMDQHLPGLLSLHWYKGPRFSVGVPSLAPGHVRQVIQAFHVAAAQGRLGAARYARDAEADTFAAAPARYRFRVADLTTLQLTLGGFPGYLASLRPRHRSIVRLDLRRIEAAGRGAVEESPLAIVDEAATLVCSIKQWHGLSDHPVLARMRLRSWADADIGGRPGRPVWAITDSTASGRQEAWTA